MVNSVANGIFNNIFENKNYKVRGNCPNAGRKSKVKNIYDHHINKNNIKCYETKKKLIMHHETLSMNLAQQTESIFPF